MATEYKYGGSKEPGRGSGPLILKGSIANPVESVQIGETIELSDEQVKEYRDRGLKFTKTDGSDDEPDNATAGDSGKPETTEQQLRSQEPGQPETGSGPRGAGGGGSKK